MIKKITLALLFTIPSLSFAIDLDGFYITPKGGVSKSMDTGVIYGEDTVDKFSIKDNDLGTGRVFGLSIWKYIASNFRLELEASQSGGLKYDSEYEHKFFVKIES